LVLEWSAGAFADLIGYGPAEIEALGGWIALVEPADLRLVQRRAQRLLAGEEAAAEYRIRTRSGGQCWLRDLGRPQWDDTHELVVGILCVAQDITEQRGSAERLLAEQRARGSLIGLLDGLVCEIDRDGVVQDVGGALQGECCDRLRNGAGRRLRELMSPDVTDAWQRQIERVVPGGPPAEFDFADQTDHGEEGYRARVCAVRDGGTLAWIRAQPAISGQSLGSGALDHLDPRVGALLDLQTGPAVLLTPDLAVYDLNTPTEWLTGWRRASAVGRSFVELMALESEQPAMSQDLERALSGTRVTGSEAWLRLPDGQEGRVVWSFTPLLDSGGSIIGLLAQGDTLAPLTDTAPVPVDDELRLKAIMDNVADGIVALDSHGVVVSFTRS
jgi:PAS domain S-box-containing protein